MRAIDHIAQRLQKASTEGVHRGPGDLDYAGDCKLDVPLSTEKGVRFLFMRHVELDRHFFCLSLSFRQFQLNQPVPFDHAFARLAAPVFFGRRIVDVMVSPPQSRDGRHWGVWCFRLFTDRAWKPLDHKPLFTRGGEQMLTWDEYHRANFK